MSEPTPTAIGELVQSVAEAHHQAFIDVDGADPDWPIWYAEPLVEDLNALLGASMTTSELVDLLISADRERTTIGPGSSVPHFSSRFFASRSVD